MQLMATFSPGKLLDLLIAELARKVEAWEMEQYPPIAKLAGELGFTGMAGRLWQSFEEERQADTKLQYLASHVLPGDKLQNRAE